MRVIEIYYINAKSFHFIYESRPVPTRQFSADQCYNWPYIRPIIALSHCGYGSVGRLSIIVGRLSVESADSPYQTCLIFDHQLSRLMGIG